MPHVYVLKNAQGKHYIGSTGQQVAERLNRHNKGDYAYTKPLRPWKIVYVEEMRSKSEAVKRERYFKTGVGRQELKRILEINS